MSGFLPPSPPTKRSKLGSENVTQGSPEVGDRNDDSGESCSICLQPMEDRAIIPTCSHEFCFDCLMIWTVQSRRCPLCTQVIGDHVIHDVRSRFDYRKHHLAPLRSNSPQLLPPQTTAAIDARNAARHRRRERERARRQREEMDERDKLELSIATRRWIYKHDLYAKHVASNSYTKYRPYPTPAQFASSQDLISRTTTFLRRELQVWQGLDVEFLTNLIISLMKAIDIRSESAVKLLSEFLDLDAPYEAGNRHVNAEHFAHEVYSYVRSPYRDLSVYDSTVQYDHPQDIPPPPQIRPQNTRWCPQSRERSRSQGLGHSRSLSRSPRRERRSSSRERPRDPRGKRRRQPDETSLEAQSSVVRRSEESIAAEPIDLRAQKVPDGAFRDVIGRGNGSGSPKGEGNGKNSGISNNRAWDSQSRGHSSDILTPTLEFGSPMELEVESSSIPHIDGLNSLKDDPRIEQRSPTQNTSPNERQTPPPPLPNKTEVDFRLKGKSRQKSLLESIQTHLKANPPIPRSVKATPRGNTPPPPLHTSLKKNSHYQNHVPLLKHLSSPVMDLVDEHSSGPEVGTSHLDCENDSGTSQLGPASEIVPPAVSNTYPIKEEMRSGAHELDEPTATATDFSGSRLPSTNQQQPLPPLGGHQANAGQMMDGGRTFATPAMEMQPPAASNPMLCQDIGSPTNSSTSMTQTGALNDKYIKGTDGKEEAHQDDKLHVGLTLYQATPRFTHGPPNSTPPISQRPKKLSQSQSELRSKLLFRLGQEKQEAIVSETAKTVMKEDKRLQTSFSRYPRNTDYPLEDQSSQKCDVGAAKSSQKSVKDCNDPGNEGSNFTSPNMRPDPVALEARLRARAKLQMKLVAEKQLGKSE